jgi:hypothetical protein
LPPALGAANPAAWSHRFCTTAQHSLDTLLKRLFKKWCCYELKCAL